MQNEIELIHITPNASEMISRIAQVCYQSKNPVPVYHLVDRGHLSVLEHATATFRIKCSIQMLLQLTRHRHLSFTVQSSRGSELNGHYETGDKFIDPFIHTFMENYKRLMERREYKKEDLAYLLPKGAMYEVFVTGNLRAWYEYLPKRMCARSQKEHQKVACMIQEILAKEEPLIFENLTAPCSTCKEERCDFA